MRSTHLKEKPPTFWTIDLFIDELINLLNNFNMQDGYRPRWSFLGGILASEFEGRRQPTGLKHLIITSLLAASSLWNQSNGQLMQAFSDDLKQGLMGGMKEPEKFFHALKEFHSESVHGCDKRPVPAEYWNTLDQAFGPDGVSTVASAP